MANNEMSIEILDGGQIKITTEAFTDPALHTEAENFLKAVSRDAGNAFTVKANKGGKVHTHTHADGTTHTHAH
jgi:hypothetical protein